MQEGIRSKLMPYVHSHFSEKVAQLTFSVEKFHERFGVNMLEYFQGADFENDGLLNLQQRLPYLIEELGEFANELNQGNYEKAINELVDVAYVVIGTLELHRISELAIAKVIEKNDKKTDETHYKAESGKVLRRE